MPTLTADIKAVTETPPQETTAVTEKPEDSSAVTETPEETTVVTAKPEETTAVTKKPEESSAVTEKQAETMDMPEKPAVTEQLANDTTGNVQSFENESQRKDKIRLYANTLINLYLWRSVILDC